MLKLGRVEVVKKIEFPDRLGITQSDICLKSENQWVMSFDATREFKYLSLTVEGEIPLHVGQEFMLALVPLEPDASTVHVGPVS
jgi:hypothetical protein